jgi:hypothetical protein
MLLALVLSYLKRKPRFVWSPALDLRDHEVLSALLPGAHS